MRLERGMDIVLIKMSKLIPHEEIKQKKLSKLIDLVKKRGGFYKPILVDRETKILLDGHHRYNTALHLGLNFIPGIEVDYLEDEETGNVYNLEFKHVGKWTENSDEIIWNHDDFRRIHESQCD